MLVLGLYAYTVSIALLAVPGWFLYRSVNYQLKRDTCLAWYGGQIKPSEATKRLGTASWNDEWNDERFIDEYCEFFK